MRTVVHHLKRYSKVWWKKNKPASPELRGFLFNAKRSVSRTTGKIGKKTNGYSRYTIISACYNVSKYVDTFVESLVNQSLDFKKNIQLIMVDDGSIDDTAEKIKYWVEKYPGNILYVYKENGGVASARNAGLPYAKHPWISFADPDDFFDYKCFKNIDDFLAKRAEKKLCFVSMNLIFYYEDRFKIKDNHPLRYRFHKKETVLGSANLGSFLQLTVHSALMKREVIQANELRFQENCKPNFEDALFVNTYFSFFNNADVGFLKDAKYFYRKRSDKTSLLDKSWSNANKYSSVIQNGYLALLDVYKKQDAIPLSVQNLICYDCGWYFKQLVNRPYITEFLSEAERKDCVRLLRSVYAHIKPEIMMNYSGAGLWFYYKVGILGCMKDMHPDYQIAYVEKYDPYKNEILIRYFTKSVDTEIFTLDGEVVEPRITKTICDTFMDEPFVYQRMIWLPLDTPTNMIFKASINGIFTRLSLNGRLWDYISTDRIKKALCRSITKTDKKYENCWLISDRDVQADDNGEHFYRYVSKNHPKTNVFFLLNKDSHDWKRLQAEGFKLLAYGSFDHYQALRSCTRIISSHADGYVLDYFGDGSSRGIPFVFLQHGVIQNDLSGWLNGKNISLFVTTTPCEHDSIAGDLSKYRFTSKEVKLLGMPRHDALIKGNDPQKMILVMPTWRHNLVGEAIFGNIRAFNPDFMDSSYAQSWHRFLCSDELRKMADKYGYKVVFFPHSNIQPYLTYFNLPDYVEVCSHSNTKIQDLFRQASMMVTDYSSVGFEMGVLNKPVVYYQFDYDEVFNKKTHTIAKGYFNYEQHGFGDVCYELDELLRSVNNVLQNGCVPEEKYLKRMARTFVFTDGKNCERVYDAIVDLTKV